MITAIWGRWIQECNWVQCYEGEIDTSHISFLHSGIDPIEGTSRFRGLAAKDGAPRLLLKETDYGLIYGARRQTGNGDYYWRVTQFMLPDYSLIPGPNGREAAGAGCRSTIIVRGSLRTHTTLITL